MVGLTESPGALLQWMVAGPERERITQEIEESIPSVIKEDTRHHGASARSTGFV